MSRQCPHLAREGGEMEGYSRSQFVTALATAYDAHFTEIKGKYVYVNNNIMCTGKVHVKRSASDHSLATEV